MKKTILMILICVFSFIFTASAAAPLQPIYVNGNQLSVNGYIENNQLIIPLTANIVQGSEKIEITDFSLSDVEIPASDGTIQKAKFYATKNSTPQPLVIWLHTWGATSDTIYTADDVVLPDEIMKHDWNYIQPNFRGMNNTPNACASDKVITDIDEAIAYAISNGNVDESKVYVVGASGGGYAAINHFMRSANNIVDGYYTWVPITDLMAWFYETRDKSYDGYYYDISNCLQNDGVLNVNEAKKRSPIFQTTPTAKLSTTEIKLYAGIRDGYNGAAVPFSHSVLMFNKLVKDSGLPNDRVPLADLFYMIKNKEPSVIKDLGTLTDGKLIKYRKTVNKLDLILFDGAHQMIINQAIKDIEDKVNSK